MGHPQPRTPIQTDNTTVEGVINNKIQPRCTKAMDMRFHWLRDRKAQGQFKIYSRPGNTNLADYFMKHHPPAHHLMSGQNFSPESKTCQKPDKQKMKARPKSQATKLLFYKGVLDKLAYEN
jgi:hypothetical protein